jgi:hypothetical protein
MEVSNGLIKIERALSSVHRLVASKRYKKSLKELRRVKFKKGEIEPTTNELKSIPQSHKFFETYSSIWNNTQARLTNLVSLRNNLFTSLIGVSDYKINTNIEIESCSNVDFVSMRYDFDSINLPSPTPITISVLKPVLIDTSDSFYFVDSEQISENVIKEILDVLSRIKNYLNGIISTAKLLTSGSFYNQMYLSLILPLKESITSFLYRQFHSYDLKVQKLKFIFLELLIMNNEKKGSKIFNTGFI